MTGAGPGAPVGPVDAVGVRGPVEAVGPVGPVPTRALHVCVAAGEPRWPPALPPVPAPSVAVASAPSEISDNAVSRHVLAARPPSGADQLGCSRLGGRVPDPS
jgi:hypothetical protein